MRSGAGEVMEEEPPALPPPPPPEAEGARDASAEPGASSSSASPCEGVVAALWALQRQNPAPVFGAGGAARSPTCAKTSVCVRKERHVCGTCAELLKRTEAQVAYYYTTLGNALAAVGLRQVLSLPRAAPRRVQHHHLQNAGGTTLVLCGREL